MLINNKKVDCISLLSVLQEEFSWFEVITEEDIEELDKKVDKFIVKNVEKPAYEEVGLDYKKDDIEFAIKNFYEMRECANNFVIAKTFEKNFY